jgi:hypothetical protein
LRFCSQGIPPTDVAQDLLHEGVLGGRGDGGDDLHPLTEGRERSAWSASTRRSRRNRSNRHPCESQGPRMGPDGKALTTLPGVRFPIGDPMHPGGGNSPARAGDGGGSAARPLLFPSSSLTRMLLGFDVCASIGYPKENRPLFYGARCIRLSNSLTLLMALTIGIVAFFSMGTPRVSPKPNSSGEKRLKFSHQLLGGGLPDRCPRLRKPPRNPLSGSRRA